MEGNYIKRERVSKLIQVVKSGMYSVLRLPSVALVNLKKRPIYSAVKVTKHVHTE